MSRDTDFDALVQKSSRSRDDASALAAARNIIQEQQRAIDRLTEPSFKPVKPKRTQVDSNSWLRVVFGDMHGSHMDRAAVAAFLGDVEAIKPKEIVILGDFIDCGGFLAEHHVMGYVAETAYNYEDDVHCAASVLDTLQRTTSAKIHYILGNHERRVERWAVTTALKSRTDRKFVLKALMDAFAIENMLALEKRGIAVIKQGETAEGAFVPATLKLGRSLYTHTGFERGGQRSAQQHIDRFGTNVAFGHTHRAEIKYGRIGGSGETVVARNPGCLCLPQPLWMHSEPSAWTQSYMLEVVRGDGTFVSFIVPIIDGASLLSDFTKRLGL